MNLDSINQIWDKLLQARQDDDLEAIEIYGEMLVHEAKVLQLSENIA